MTYEAYMCDADEEGMTFNVKYKNKGKSAQFNMRVLWDGKRIYEQEYADYVKMINLPTTLTNIA